MKRSWMLLSLLAVLALFGAACGGDDDADSGDGGGGEEAQDICATDSTTEEVAAPPDVTGKTFADYDLSGIDITVGSKDFTEQLVLGEMLVQAYEAAGANVTSQVNLGGTEVNRQALLSGDIDSYAEYNGTGWTVHLGCEDPVFDPETLTNNVAIADLAANDIHWLSRSPFNNTYGFAVNQDYVDANGEPTLQDMADYIAANPDATVCMESEFPDRPDGLVLYEEATDSTIPDDQISIIDTNLIYTETEGGGCTFGEIFTTDGRIPELGLTVVDDGGTFILYNVSVNLRDDVYQENPEAFDAIAEMLLMDLDNDTAQELNRRVGSGGEDQADVAQDYLEQQGLI